MSISIIHYLVIMMCLLVLQEDGFIYCSRFTALFKSIFILEISLDNLYYTYILPVVKKMKQHNGTTKDNQTEVIVTFDNSGLSFQEIIEDALKITISQIAS